MGAVHVVGAGGIGCALGYALSAVGWAVTFVERNPRKVEAGRRDGVRVDERPFQGAAFVPFDDWSPPAEALVLLATKCYDNATVLERLPPNCVLIPVQNGFDPRLAAHGHECEGIASFVSECETDRPRTRITRKGELHLGPRKETVPGGRAAGPCSALSAALRRAGLFRVVDVPAVEPFKYTKVMYNAAISPLAAAAGIDNGQLLSVPAARRLFFALIRENHRILAAAKVPLGRVGPFHPDTVARILSRRWLASLMARAFEPSLRGTYCSMAGDVERGRTEMDNYNGHLIRLADGTGTPCPLNRVAYELVTGMAREGWKPHPGVFDNFAPVMGPQARRAA